MDLKRGIDHVVGGFQRALMGGIGDYQIILALNIHQVLTATTNVMHALGGF